MNYSKRTNWNTEESELARAHRERLAAGLPIADLTASNPTRCGFEYPADLLHALVDPAAFDYDPIPRGSLHARLAVCDYYADHGIDPDPGQLLLTTSTSEAYGYLFKLLCDPGDEVLVLQPGYPLFDYLADAEVVRLIPVPLIYDHGWQLDLEGIRLSVSAATKAVVLVNPNNPTGHFTSIEEARELANICRELNLALIVDEVFLDYAFEAGTVPAADSSTFAARPLPIPVFIVSGISKICGLPQMKAAWILAIGPGTHEAMARLEVVADTYLSLNAPVQLALPLWLRQRPQIQNQIKHRVQINLAELDRRLSAAPKDEILVNRLQLQGGWYAILRVPATQPDELTARELLNAGVWIHPGYFFGFANSGWLVVSLLPEKEEFAKGIKLLLTYFRSDQESYFLRG